MQCLLGSGTNELHVAEKNYLPRAHHFAFDATVFDFQTIHFTGLNSSTNVVESDMHARTKDGDSYVDGDCHRWILPSIFSKLLQMDHCG
jgi:hypothetical protein